MPIWAPAGLALAAVMLRGIRVWPAVFAAALASGPPTDIVDAAAADSILMSSAVAIGNTLEAVVGGYLVNVWSQGRATFDTPAGTAKFALVGLGPASLIGAAVGVGSLYLAGYADPAAATALALTWWLRDAAGILVVAPVVVLWALTAFQIGRAPV